MTCLRTLLTQKNVVTIGLTEGITVPLWNEYASRDICTRTAWRIRSQRLLSLPCVLSLCHLNLNEIPVRKRNIVDLDWFMQLLRGVVVVSLCSERATELISDAKPYLKKKMIKAF